LLPYLGNAAQALKKKKITKETILLDAIEYIQLLKHSIAVKSATVITFEDPFTLKISQQEIDAGFAVMFKSINQSMYKITDLR
jgi:hypothetical protein